MDTPCQSKPCPFCDGSGQREGKASPMACWDCAGTGKVSVKEAVK